MEVDLLKHQENLHFTFSCFFMLFHAFGAFWRKKRLKSTCLLFTSNPMYFFLFFLLFYYFFRYFSGEFSNFFEFFSAFFCLSEKNYFLKCSTFLARIPSILKSREDYFFCTFPLLLLKSMKKHEKAWKSMKKHEKVKCSWWRATQLPISAKQFDQALVLPQLSSKWLSQPSQADLSQAELKIGWYPKWAQLGSWAG